MRSAEKQQGGDVLTAKCADHAKGEIEDEEEMKHEQEAMEHESDLVAGVGGSSRVDVPADARGAAARAGAVVQ